MTSPTPLLLVLLFLGAARSAWAEGPHGLPAEPDAAEAAREEQSEPPIAIDVTLRALTAYYDTGFLQERRGLVFQPEVELAYRFVEQDDWVVKAVAEVFASFHEYPTLVDDPTGFLDHWYEISWGVGLALELGQLEIRGLFGRVMSPSDAFGDFEGFTLEVAYADEGWARGFSLHPRAALSVETLGALDEVARGVLLEVGLEPTWTLPCTPLGGVAFRFPTEVALSVQNYFQQEDGTDHAFGFLSVGAFVDLPLPSLPGEPALELGLTYYLFGTTLEEYNDRDDDTVLSVGIAFSL